MYKRKPKLEIETNERTDADLAWLAENDAWTEDGKALNKSTLINRAVQVYAELQRSVAAGKHIYVGHILPDSAELTLMTWE